MGVMFYLWGKLEHSEKTIEMSQVTDKLNPIKLYEVHYDMSKNTT